MVGESDFDLFGFIGLRIVYPAGPYLESFPKVSNKT